MRIKVIVMSCTSAIKDGRSYDVSSIWDRLDFLLTSLGYILVYQMWSPLRLYTCKLAMYNILMFLKMAIKANTLTYGVSGRR